ncbi:MAG: Tat pathway signal protein [Proteobacteria bacterium ST_bin13]|nr:MAG: Tat pathway signal protein [Proteobacteria bacterium ST_bin13]
MDRRQFLSSSGAVAALSLTPSALRAAAPAGDAAINALFEAIFQEGLDDSPESVTQLGLDTGKRAAAKGQLGDRSLAARAADLARTKKAIARIEAIGTTTLSETAKLNREVVLYSLNSSVVGPDKFGIGSTIRPYRIFQQGGAYFSVPDFLNSAHTIRTTADAEAYCARLSAFATALDQDSAVQKEEAARGFVAPDFSLDLTIGQLKALRGKPAAASAMVNSLVTRAKAAGLTGDWATKAAAIVESQVYPALDRQIALVQALPRRKEAGLWALPNGDAIYAEALKAATTTDFTPDEVHKIGKEQVASLSAELDAILKAQGLTKGSVGARLTALNDMPSQLYADTAEGRAELLAGLNVGVAAMQKRLGEAFLNPPSEPLDIRAVPVEIQDGASNGYYRRASLDGTRPAIYFINLKSVGDWPKYTLPSLSYHEGVPGHHLQLSIVQKLDSPLLRRLSGFSAYSEGWALYAEQVAEELGGYANAIERAGYLQSFLFRAARLVADTGIHAKRWTREQATDYFVETVGFARPRSLREIERYCTQAGQACSYKLGHISWLRARDNAKRILGDKFDLKQFHEVLRDGAVPLTILERLVEARAKAQLG